MPKVSVITCTAKAAPNLDKMANCLRAQIFTDFEWVIVDRLLFERPTGYYDEIRKVCAFDVKVLSPKTSVFHEFNMPDVSNARNTGIMASAGELVVWYDDNMYILPDYIQRHFTVYKIPENTYLVGLFWPFDNWSTISEISQKEPYDTHGNFCRVGDFAVNNPGVEKGGKIRPDDNRAYSPCPPVEGCEIRYMGYECIKGAWCYNGNLSMSMELLLLLNGYDEHLDGTFGGEDINIGLRADNAGYKGLLDRYCCAYDYRGEENTSTMDTLPFKWDHIGEFNGSKLTRADFGFIDIQRNRYRVRENAWMSLEDMRSNYLKRG